MLAAYLKQLRQRSQLSSSHWATASGISRTTLWRWEHGKALPRDEELKMALAALSASPDEHKRAMQLLWQERIAKGIGSVPTFTETGLRRTDLLKALRLRRGWTQREAAEQLRINRVTLAGWETGDHWPEANMLHTACQRYGASPEELAALTTLSAPSSSTLLPDLDDIVWPDIETYNGDFSQLELHYLTCRARLAQISHAHAREREIACTLDYLHSLMIQPRCAEVRRELRRLASHPHLPASPELSACHKRLYAVAQESTPKAHQIAERALRSVLDMGDSVPLAERCRVKAEWAERCAERGDQEAALRLSGSSLADAHASGTSHLFAIGQRQYTAVCIVTNHFNDAAKALEQFPTHTPLFAVQKVFTQALLLHRAGSFREAATSYNEAAQAAQAEGMTGYADGYARLAASLSST